MVHAEDMRRAATQLESLTQLFDGSNQPIYAVDGDRRIVYCNPALAVWLDLEPKRIIGRQVEYHSENLLDHSSKRDDGAALTELCPPPRALAGAPCSGIVSCAARDGRLIHRQADFLPIAQAADVAAGKKRSRTPAATGAGVLVLMSATDMSPQQLASELSPEPTGDELHRLIRRFRREQAGRYGAESLLGGSPAMKKVRTQVTAAATCGANALILGRHGSGRGHIARAIHYQAGGDGAAKLVPIDCALVTDELLRRAFDTLRTAAAEVRCRATLLLEHVDFLPEAYQEQILRAVADGGISAQIVATAECSPSQEVTGIQPALRDAISTIMIEVPRLSERPEDLPVLAQFFLEECNRDSDKQVGSLRGDAIEQLSLYEWPGELTQLRQVIAAAHVACNTHEVTASDLPPVIHHAARAAFHRRRPPEPIVLDDLLAKIEREAIVRALDQAKGNKSEAATLLGMTRPRLYRRLVQLGLAGDETAPSHEQPEFIEQDAEGEPT
jgi:DNA-binding NtrC family response regulator